MHRIGTWGAALVSSMLLLINAGCDSTTTTTATPSEDTRTASDAVDKGSVTGSSQTKGRGRARVTDKKTQLEGGGKPSMVD